MKNKLITLLLISVLVVMSCLPAYAASSVTYEVPDFEPYAESAGYDLSQYPYYVILGYEESGTLYFDCYYAKSNFILTENADTSGGSWSTTYFIGYFTLTEYVRVRVNTDFEGVYISHSVTSNKTTGLGTTYQYIKVHSNFLYSNHNIIEKHTDNSISTFFMQAPFSEGQKVTIGTTISAQVLQQPLKRQILFLVPLVISLLVFSQGLRKALVMLFQILRRA